MSTATFAHAIATPPLGLGAEPIHATTGGATQNSSPFYPDAARIQLEIETMAGRVLSKEFAGWVARYGAVGKRNPYLWNWCRQAVELTTLPCVPQECRSELCDTKTLGVMWDVMLDDLADRSGDANLLEPLLNLPLDCECPDTTKLSRDVAEYVQFAADLWHEIMARARRYPLFMDYEQLLRFDYLQLCNAMRYSHLLNSEVRLMNLFEHDLYTPANMHIMICSTLDLMNCPGFDRAELGRLRQLISYTQWMGRIGNLVTTWQREIGENDYTSGVFASAVSAGDLSPSELSSSNRAALERAIIDGRHEEVFLNRWQQHRRALFEQGSDLRSFAVGDLVAAYERLFCLHIGSRGNK